MDYILLFKILGWGVFCFNIYTIYVLWKSNIFYKWWKMLFPLMLNSPTFIYSQFQGLFFKFFMFQSLGRATFTNYQLNPFEDVLIGESVAVCVPIGALYVFFKLNTWIRDKEHADEGI